MSNIDIIVQNYFSLIRTPFITEFMYLLSSLFDFSFYFLAITFFVALLVYLVRNFRYAVLFVSTLLFGIILVYLLKSFFNVGRPVDTVIYAFGQSFPSYHATVATIFFSLLMYIFDDYFKGSWRVIFNIFCITLIFLIAFSRVYLGVHWLSDVAFGILLGSLICYFSVTVFKKFTGVLE